MCYDLKSKEFMYENRDLNLYICKSYIIDASTSMKF